MKFKYVVAVAYMATMSSCATNYTYEPIIPNPPNMEMAQAQCQMMSSSTQQGVVAWGSTSYVAGAQLGNAIGNAVRADQFVQQCMTMSGWRRVSLPPQGQTKPVHSEPVGGLTADQRKQAVDFLAMGYIADTCKVKISADKLANLKALRAEVGPDIIAQGRALGEKTINDNAKNIGRAAVCQRAVGIIKDMGWS
ncbi:hypothetical protein [Rhizobium leucaenae]|uniref:Lipoprotein n=1 Tax=Rhizobium leucaenae TaxID=29450 RepID=A0A7W6ZYK4_9HYPH|nr:hypothetical protein [Rhizobium leucaenae]MBB4570597.1 hypothetical protein [Rhizobium leucaenae]